MSLKVFVASKPLIYGGPFLPKDYTCPPTADEVSKYRDKRIPMEDYIFIGPFPVSSTLKGHQTKHIQESPVQRQMHLNAMAQLGQCDLVYFRIENLESVYDFFYAGAAVALHRPVFIDIAPDCPREHLNEIAAASIFSVQQYWMHEFLPAISLWRYTQSQWTKSKYIHHLKFTFCD